MINYCCQYFCGFNLTIYSSAGPDLLDPLNPRIYFLNCPRSGAKRIIRIFMARILAMDLIPSNLAFLLFIRSVKWQKPVTNHTKIKKIGIVSPFGWQIKSQLFQRCGPAFNKTKITEAWTTDIVVCQIIVMFLLFFLNCLLITNNNNVLLMSRK